MTMATNAESIDASIALKTTLLNELEQDKSIKNIYTQYGNRIFVPADRMKVVASCKKELKKLKQQKDQQKDKQP
ncbi:hypothetical protein TcWFU_006770 [Taenia crassiceps]|uniref:Uncharacterized protein n=1 Tax=Taenia crassiceps TaxID=6207 RepID=A0ABR4Q838_9CEST